ncbi:uncharacterized protein BX663DRAFT_516319 [Cokeromyces recurvatus]|uniref:uncharacterized protein n=1 Tax=Cokeromyces recurvatus TaxID=90255 RepID=UPI00221FCF66|nr:uncharacterized protein BX663DRAFT_516319 [Cokeromyces recurvatus]KAI7900734.1 hypothetical protein BX663DRAFT_516319 [Cokeromyces recurvatus]
MESIKPKRFSFASFGRAFSFNNNNSVPKQQTSTKGDSKDYDKEPHHQSRRSQKSKSLYVKSTNKTIQTAEIKDIRRSIRHSLASVLYAAPHSMTSKEGNMLVPVLVTSELSESLGGVLVANNDKPHSEEEEEEGQKKKKVQSIEYDHTLEIVYNKDSMTILWQGYGYTIDEKAIVDTNNIMSAYEKDRWESYQGLIHPIHLFSLDITLNVTELKRYYDNYGSMMLKIREIKMLNQQQQQYHPFSKDTI